jgi:DNA-3-methyladenine glycosylase II
MMRHAVTVEVAGPWSLRTSKRFWEGFGPTAISPGSDPDVLDARFIGEHDWTPATARITQHGTAARIEVSGDGDLDAAAEQVARFLCLDIDAADWPGVADRDPIVAAAQQAMPGFRPCGFHSPYEAAAWAVLSAHTRIPEAVRLRRELIAAYGADGAFPAPDDLVRAVETGGLVLPGRKAGYLLAVAHAAQDGLLEGPRLRALPEDDARRQLRSIVGIGPFGADLILIRGANTVDVLPRAEPRLDAEITHLYGPGATLADVAEAWRPFRSWAAVYLRALRGEAGIGAGRAVAGDLGR